MNEMNSLTHSCIHSLASFAILAFSGSAIFIMRATGAKLRMLASEAEVLAPSFGVCGGEVDCGDADDMAPAAGPPFSRYTEALVGRPQRLAA
jgi:hypothetical protein